MNKLIRPVLQLAEYAGLKVANFAHRAPVRPGVDDLLKSSLMAQYCCDAESILDVGCGTGRRLVEMSLFLPDSVQLEGVDLAIRGTSRIPGGRVPNLDTFDGRTLGFPDNSMDVVMVCYVLHHLPIASVPKLLSEVCRVARRRVLILEDSMEEWSLPYRLRNWAHLVESNLLYDSESDAFQQSFDTQGFRTIDEWESLFQGLSVVGSIQRDDLTEIKRYEHHRLFILEIETPKD